MKVLVIGNGAREHALVCKVARSPRADAIYALPGNAGTAGIAHNIDISSSDIPAIIKKARELHIGLVVVGPERRWRPALPTASSKPAYRYSARRDPPRGLNQAKLSPVS